MKNLFYWLEKLQFGKVIHANAEAVLDTAHDFEVLNVVAPHEAFISNLPNAGTSAEEQAADAMLFAVHIKAVDAFITEDGRTLANAAELGLGDRVVNTNRFISGALYKHPELIKYKSLAVKPMTFKDCDLSDQFFDSFKEDYEGFEDWFKKKADSEVYVCKGDDSAYLGFLFLKFEDEKEDYSDIIPAFEPKRRLKVGTLKVESSGFRLGERFIQIIFEHAQKYGVDEIYVTLFKEREEVQRLYELLKRWGFVDHGFKTHKDGRAEAVMVKSIEYDTGKTIQANFPAVQYRKRKLYLPILEKFHKRLIPDAERRDDLVANEACRYALEKVYVTTATQNPVKNGDLLIVYRMGDIDPKHYSSIVTAVGVVKEIRTSFDNKEDFMRECQNRSVFTTEELELLWQNKRTLGVVRFLTLRTFNHRPPLKWLREQGFFAYNEGPRPFTEMTDAQFNAILQEAGVTNINWF
ncbi:MAG: hypothetical protein LBE13_11510 [Bacteroidales bacterium]|jgi:hypothetical protein|nr:hypothetical protein [Bacteroidales bacterium]